jgi:hypothetical protein
MADMTERWLALKPVAARDEALFAYLMAEHPDATGPEGMTAMFQAAIRFNERWPHEVPRKWDMVQADRAGKLSEFTARANARFDLDSACLSKQTA